MSEGDGAKNMTDINSAEVVGTPKATPASSSNPIDFQGRSAEGNYSKTNTPHTTPTRLQTTPKSTQSIQSTHSTQHTYSLNMPPGFPNLKPGQKEAQEKAAREHQELMEELDIAAVPKPFRNPSWRPNGQRRNKTIKMILAAEEAERIKKANALAANAVSEEVETPVEDGDVDMSGTDGTNTPIGDMDGAKAGDLAKAVLEKNLKRDVTAVEETSGSNAPMPSYTNIEAGPSMRNPKKYCDITGLEAPYTDPKTRLRYHNMEVAGVIKTLGPGVAEQYLEARGAHTILK